MLRTSLGLTMHWLTKLACSSVCLYIGDLPDADLVQPQKRGECQRLGIGNVPNIGRLPYSYAQDQKCKYEMKLNQRDVASSFYFFRPKGPYYIITTLFTCLFNFLNFSRMSHVEPVTIRVRRDHRPHVPECFSNCDPSVHGFQCDISGTKLERSRFQLPCWG